MNPADAVRALWERMDARDWDGARATLVDDYVSYCPATGERFTPADNFIAMNQAYPEGWSVVVDEVVADGPRVVARVRIPFRDQVFHCVSFADVEDGRIARSTDFWVTDLGEEPPDWRAPYRVPAEPGEEGR